MHLKYEILQTLPRCLGRDGCCAGGPGGNQHEKRSPVTGGGGQGAVPRAGRGYCGVSGGQSAPRVRPWSRSLPRLLSHEAVQTAPPVWSSPCAGTAPLIWRGADERPERDSALRRVPPWRCGPAAAPRAAPPPRSALHLPWELRLPACQGLLPPAAAGRLRARAWAWGRGRKNGKDRLCPSGWPQPGAASDPDL